MIFGYLVLATALIISLSSAVYSILGLTAIFAAAFWPIVIMGGSLEIGKIVTTLWLHKYWDRAEIQYKLYLCSAVAVLMFLTSMGVFGFLSKAHSDQTLVSGDVQSKVAIYDEKIKTAKENIESNRRALAQLDAGVDQVLGRSTTEQGADKAIAIRKSQAAERKRIATEIEADQKKISSLNEQAAPIRAEIRKVDAEVGPIKYIAAMVYGDNPDANLLEHAVRWVIILIVAVFDPLALTLLLAATKAIEWERGINIFNIKKRNEDEEAQEEAKETLDELEPNYDADDGEFAREQWEQFSKILAEEQQNKDLHKWDEFFKGEKSFQDIEKEIIPESIQPDPLPTGDVTASSHFGIKEPEPTKIIVEEDIEPYGSDIHKHAMKVWKLTNPNHTYNEQFDLLDKGIIKKLPWEDVNHLESLNLSDGETAKLKLGLQADNDPTTGEVQGFGIKFPTTSVKGDMFLRVDHLPSQLYKFNGQQWIRVNKNLSDTYVYDDAYINHLIEKIGSGEYDPDLLSDV